MSRVPMPAPDAVTDPTTRRVYGEIERDLGFGMVPNVFRAMATNPAFLEANWNLFRSVVLHGELPRVLKEMVGIVVSSVHASPYARAVHMHSLGVQGIDPDVVRALGEGSTEPRGLPPASIAALRFARRAAERPGGLTDADFAALAQAGLSQSEVFELLSAIQLFTAVNVFTDIAAVEIDAL